MFGGSGVIVGSSVVVIVGSSVVTNVPLGEGMLIMEEAMHE